MLQLGFCSIHLAALQQSVALAHHILPKLRTSSQSTKSCINKAEQPVIPCAAVPPNPAVLSLSRLYRRGHSLLGCSCVILAGVAPSSPRSLTMALLALGEGSVHARCTIASAAASGDSSEWIDAPRACAQATRTCTNNCAEWQWLVSGLKPLLTGVQVPLVAFSRLSNNCSPSGPSATIVLANSSRFAVPSSIAWQMTCGEQATATCDVCCRDDQHAKILSPQPDALTLLNAGKAAAAAFGPI